MWTVPANARRHICKSGQVREALADYLSRSRTIGGRLLSCRREVLAYIALRDCGAHAPVAGNESNLTDLVHTLCIICGQEPPLFSRGPGQATTQTRPTVYHPQPAVSSAQSYIPVATPVNVAANARANNNTPFQSYPPVSSSTHSSTLPATTSTPAATPIGNSSVVGNSVGGAGRRSEQEPGEVFRKRAIAVLTEKLQKSLKRYNEKAVEELDTMFEKQNVLRDRKLTFEQVEKDLGRERDGLEEVLQLLQVGL